jgi:hypothetical protein
MPAVNGIKLLLLPFFVLLDEQNSSTKERRSSEEVHDLWHKEERVNCHLTLVLVQNQRWDLKHIE